MEQVKPWYQSQTVWGGLIAVAASVLHATGTTLSPECKGDLTDAAVNFTGAVGGLIAIYGRLRAEHTIT